MLARIGGDDYAATALAEIEATLAGESDKVDFRELLHPKMARVLVLGVVLAVFQQWCGINVIFNYAEEIFRDAGYDISDVLKNIAWTGSVNLAFTFVALGVVDRGGRRPLMLLGAAGLAVIYTAMGGCYFAGVQGWPMLLLVLAAIGCYAMSLAPVTWVVISEIFPNRIRGAAMSVAVSSLWIACFILTYTFPLLNKRLGSAGTFWLYAAICAGRVRLHLVAAAGDQGQDPGGDRKGSRGLRSRTETENSNRGWKASRRSAALRGVGGGRSRGSHGGNPRFVALCGRWATSYCIVQPGRGG